MKPDPLDELEARLFSAARKETPSGELRARILATPVETQAAANGERLSTGDSVLAVPEVPTTIAPSLVASHRRVPRWLFAAAVFGILALLFQRWHSKPETLPISPEEVARSPRPRAPIVTTQVPAPPLPPVEVNSPPAPATTSSHAHATDPRRAPPRVAPEPVRSEAPPAPSPSTSMSFGAQLELLKRARAMLRSGNGAGALAALDEHAGELARSEMSAEAAVLRMEALSSAGRQDEAASVAETFIDKNPNSPLADRARSFLRARGSAPPDKTSTP